MKRLTQLLATLPFALGALIPATGCNQVAEEVAEQAVEAELGKDGSANIDIDGDSMSINVMTDEGAVVLQGGDHAEIPSDMPKDIPIYKGISVTMSHSQSQKGVFTIQGTSDDSLETVASFYEKEVVAAGWTEDTQVKQTNMRMFKWEKDGRVLNVILSGEGNGTSLVVNVGKN